MTQKVREVVTYAVSCGLVATMLVLVAGTVIWDYFNE